MQFLNLLWHDAPVLGTKAARALVGLVGLGGLGTLDTVAGRLALQQVLGDGAVEVFVGGRGSHGGDPGVLESMWRRQTLRHIQHQQLVYEIFGQGRHILPMLHTHNHQYPFNTQQ